MSLRKLCVRPGCTQSKINVKTAAAAATVAADRGPIPGNARSARALKRFANFADSGSSHLYHEQPHAPQQRHLYLITSPAGSDCARPLCDRDAKWNGRAAGSQLRDQERVVSNP